MAGTPMILGVGSDTTKLTIFPCTRSTTWPLGLSEYTIPNGGRN
jgi:hypothetical protein